MKDQENIKYVKAGITGCAVVAVALLLYFGIEKLEVIGEAFASIIRILMPFVYGAVIAYLLAPACNWFQALYQKHFQGKWKKLADPLAIVSCLLVALLTLWALVMLVLPQLTYSVVNLVETTPQKVQATNLWLHNVLENQPELQSYWDSYSVALTQKINQLVSEENLDKLLDTAQKVIGNVGSSVISVVSVLKDFIIGIIVSVYFLAERKRFLAQGKMALYSLFSKKWADLIADEIAYADMMFNGFITGKILDSAIIGVICFVCTSIMKLPSPALISTIVGVTNIIPFFGPFIGAIPCSFLLLLEKPIYCVYFVIFIIILQQVDGNIIGPKILGNTTGLSSFWVLFAILLFGGKWGLVGMVVGVPLWAVIYDIFRRIVFDGLKKKGRYQMMVDYNHQFGQPEKVGDHPKPKAPRSRLEKKFQKKKK